MSLRNSLDLNLLISLDALLTEASVTRAALRVGLSTPAMSHALSRLRKQLGDPLLVRAGRGMVLSAKGEMLKSRIRPVLNEIQDLFASSEEFTPNTLSRSFLIHVTDYILFVLGPEVDRLVHEEAPSVCLQYLPNVPEDAQLLREGRLDLAIGVYHALPPEIQTRKLFSERLVCLVCEEHPLRGSKVTLEQYVSFEHIQIAPRGRQGGYVDQELANRGLSRRVVRMVPYFLSGIFLLFGTNYLLTLPERAAHAAMKRFRFRVLAPPLDFSSYNLTQIWHPRNKQDPAHRWLRSIFLRAGSNILVS